jgi:hypothetical protein
VSSGRIGVQPSSQRHTDPSNPRDTIHNTPSPRDQAKPKRIKVECKSTETTLRARDKSVCARSKARHRPNTSPIARRHDAQTTPRHHQRPYTETPVCALSPGMIDWYQRKAELVQGSALLRKLAAHHNVFREQTQTHMVPRSAPIRTRTPIQYYRR